MTSEATEIFVGPRARAAARARPHRRLALEQLGVLVGQGLAGAGNLAFSLVMVRLLAPKDFAALASFGALYLLLTMPATSLTAGAALEPGLEERLRRRLLLAGCAVAVAGGALALPLGRLLHLSPVLVALLALAAPGAGPLALARGRLYAVRRHRRLVASLAVEPAARLVLGGVLASTLGATGGGLAIVLAGYAALLAAGPSLRDRFAAATPAPGSEHVVVGAFVLLALLQNQDVVLGNAVLGGHSAAVFAVVSTIGGIAAFATVTVPMVLLARVREGRREPVAVAIAVAGAVGGLALAAFALAPVSLTSALFGARYAAAGGIALAYLLAMALLGVTRVVTAQLAAHGRGRLAIGLLAGAVLLQFGLVVGGARSAAGVAAATLAATALAALTTGAAAALELPSVRRAPARTLVALRSPVALPLTGIVLVAVGLRFLITRGLWIDEASSVSQAEMSFHGMLHTLRTSDVHPPLYFSLLWLDVRAFGDGELAVRLPSIVAGALLVPLLYVAGRDLYDRRAGLVAAALGAFAPQVVWYSQEARMYALFMLLATVAVWMQVRLVRHARARDWAVYVVAAAALAWTQYFSLLLVAAQQVVFALVAWRRPAVRRRLVRDWLLAASAFVVLVAPLLPFAYHQFAVNQASGRGFVNTPSQAGGAIAGETHPSLYAFLANVVWAVWGYHADATMVDLVALWPLAMLFALLLLGRGWSKISTLLVASALAPAVGLFVVGQTKSDLFDLRYFIGAVPLLLLLAGRALTAFTRSVCTRAGLAAVVGLSLAAGLADQQLNNDNPRRYDFRKAVETIDSRVRPGDVVLFNPGYLSTVVRYYGPTLDARPITAPVPRRARHVFVIGSFFDHPAIAAATGKELATLERTRRLVVRAKATNVRVWEFR